jgi:hypothetical protein
VKFSFFIIIIFLLFSSFFNF